MAVAFVFPGQGSQAVGMAVALAEAFPAAREVFEEVDDALSQKLSALMRDGPESDLTATANAQPALMAVSVAVARVLEREAGRKVIAAGRFVAGHSLGEYSALAAAGALGLADAARLLRVRGDAMHKATPPGTGGMAALIGIEIEEAEALAAEAAEKQVCVAANDNAPGQIVLSGHAAAIDRAVALAAAKGRKAVKLSVSAPFHSPLMAPAAEVMARALEEARLVTPVVPVIANVIAAPVSDPARIRALLVQQVTGRVRWRESVQAMAADEVETLVELGSGKVLAGLARRIDKSLRALSVGTPQEIEDVLKVL